jgi:hypothetical protein
MILNPSDTEPSWPPNPSDTESIWYTEPIRYWTYKIPTLSDFERFWYRSNLILNLSDTEPIGYRSPSDTRTYQILNRWGTEPIKYQTYQILNISDNIPVRYWAISTFPFKSLDDRQSFLNRSSLVPSPPPNLRWPPPYLQSALGQN